MTATLVSWLGGWGRWLVVLWAIGLALISGNRGFSELSDSIFSGSGDPVGYWPYFLVAALALIGAGATAFRRAWGAALVVVASGGLLALSVVVWQSDSWRYNAPFSADSVEVAVATLVAAIALAAVVAVAMARRG